ncbi:CHAD domain-containing protein [Marinobacter sp. TBZ242]|uniref:CHAD domain-containing protein n=1 Tax=Marinobacter azerbaijanicus TaxID=3050455 RepID=A0ABT7IK02_9GAMM|nr:CHAD domain-containing protein [Marinobacter sp. TBZ242]MDL0434040.1 CHAD domain-containing protein [Marinobacter sp. TBZ242]
MRYRLTPNGNFAKHLRRLMRSINDDIALSLLRACRDPETGVHEARKGCKEIRAVLRLVKPHMDKADFSDNQSFYKEVSGKLSGNRDALVRTKTWNHLLAETLSLEGKPADTVASFLSAQAQLDPLAEKGSDFFVDLALEVDSNSKSPKDWSLPKSLSDLVPNLKKIYQEARKAEKKARQSEDIEDFHEFRKRSKDLFYCLRILRPMFGKGLKSKVSQLQNLTEAQGDANDYAVLTDYLIDHREALELDEKDFELVKHAIQAKLHDLQDRAHRQAKKLLSDSPGAFIKLL